MEESNPQDQPGRARREVRRTFIVDLLGRAGELGMTTADVANMLQAAGLANRRQTVSEDLGELRAAGVVEQREEYGRWFAVADKPVVHSLSPGAESTLCCGMAPEDLPAGEVFADGPGQVTCGFDGPVGPVQGRREVLRDALLARIDELRILIDAGADEEKFHNELVFLEMCLVELERAEGPVFTLKPGGQWGDGQVVRRYVEAGEDPRTVDDMPERVDFRPDEGEAAPRTGVYRTTEDGGQVLEMPWTVVKSEGGPYDDDSYAAGLVAGTITEMLSVGQKLGMTLSVPLMIPKVMRDQVDAIAMRFGYYLLTDTAWDNPEYDSGYVRFTSEIPGHPDDGDDDGRDQLDDSDSE